VSGSATYRYGLFGLTIRSELELGELSPSSSDDDNDDDDLVIRVGALDPGLPCSADHHQLRNAGLLVIEGVGRYLARGGRELLIEPAPGVPLRNLRLYLLGSAMGMILHQRGLLPLHANAVVIEGRAFAFTGPAGSGKSTLAAWFQDRGYRMLSDDVCAIGFDPADEPIAWPGLPRLRLWRDALERSGRRPGDFSRSFEEQGDDWEKYDVPASADRMEVAPQPLAGVILLERADAAELSKLSQAKALATLFANLYRGEYLHGGQHETAWRACLRLATAIPVWRWSRPWSIERFDPEVLALIAQLTVRSE
jgi:hypothetical protein